MKNLFLSLNAILIQFHELKNVVRLQKQTPCSPPASPTWNMSHLLYFLSSEAGCSKESQYPMPDNNTVSCQRILAPSKLCCNCVNTGTWRIPMWKKWPDLHRCITYPPTGKFSMKKKWQGNLDLDI